MIDPVTLAQINGAYLPPAGAGPAWRAAMEFGFDMSLVEDTLRLSPEQRLDEHQQLLNFHLEIEAARALHSAHGPG
jgi:hypothetical protein